MKKLKEPSKKENKQRKRASLPTWLLVMVLFTGLGIMAYPTISNWWNTIHASHAITTYSNAVSTSDQEKLSRMLEEAHAYNSRLMNKENPYLMTDEDLEEYNALLDLSGTGIMGYIGIPSIGVEYPIYHGVDDAVLQTAIGHIEWSSLPVGGESTHAAVSGHRGMPGAKLFSDLDKMKEGDSFTITVLNQTIRYKVDQIRIVEPDDVSELEVVPGKDYCTLTTCTPYAINTHRLLIRGRRITEEAGELTVPAEALRVPNAITIPAVSIPLLLLFLGATVLVYRFRKPRIREEDLRRILEDPEDTEQ